MPNKHILLKRIQPEENLYHYTKCRGVQGILKDKAYLESVYKQGAEKASYVANKTLRKVYKKVGFIAR